MKFAPLSYVWSTVTIWHLIVFGVLLAVVAWPASTERSGTRRLAPRVSYAAVVLFFLYVIGAIVLGQAFGDKFSFSQLWPTSIVMGFLSSLIFVSSVMIAEEGRLGWGMAAATSVVLTAFNGLALCLVFFLLPRMVGWFGVVELPIFSWAVSLP